MKKWLDSNAKDLSNKTIAITGSTGGILSNVVLVLAQLNANLILINRDKEKTAKQFEHLRKINPNISLHFVECDLSNINSVKSAVARLKSFKIDILMLASAIYNVKRHFTNSGYDNIFQTNFLSHYYITKQLLPNLKTNNGKVVVVGSIAYKYSSIDIEDIEFLNESKQSKIYGNSKRFLMFSIAELCKRENIMCSVVHPGVTLTNMTNHYHKSINWLVRIFIKLFFTSMDDVVCSILKSIYSATTQGDWIGPKYFNVWGKPKTKNMKHFSAEESLFAYGTAEKICNKF